MNKQGWKCKNRTCHVLIDTTATAGFFCAFGGYFSFNYLYLIVKRWFTYILLFYLLFTTLVPCSIFDRCEDGQQATQTAGRESKKDCSNCSPFCVCSPAYCFTYNQINPSIEPLTIQTLLTYGDRYVSSKTDYYFDFFRPPRLS